MLDNTTVDNVFCESASKMIRKQADAIAKLSDRLNNDFSKACELILSCKGKTVVVGMGKSGHIGRKLSATLSSTGTSSFFVHAAEAMHGDLGMITANDCVLAISNSGETHEVISLLAALKQKQVPIISFTGRPQSTLARASNFHIDVSVDAEACPLGLAPTTSTTAALVMGDALAMALCEARGFTKHDFALSHPQGSLGRQLTTTVSDLMVKGEAIPRVQSHDPLPKIILEMTSKNLGITTVYNPEKQLVGIITDGDLRRYWQQPHAHMEETLANEIMTTSFKTILADTLAMDALTLCHRSRITSLVVLHPDRHEVAGIIHIHHILNANLIAT